MIRKSDIEARRLDRAVAAGDRWNASRGRRAEAVAKLAIGGPANADLPVRVEAFLGREEAKRRAYARAGVTSAFFAERRIGPTLDLDEAPPNDAARLAGRPVGRIVSLVADGGVEGFATGFLVAPNMVLTNHHVFATAGEAAGCAIQFGYERTPTGLAAGVTYELDPSVFFFTHSELDFTLVGIASAPLRGAAADRFDPLPLIPAVGKILVGQAVSIIQYPDGGPKRYGVRDNELLIAPTPEDLFLRYTTDTLPGSSGSPAFNKDWEVVALHHSGVPEVVDGKILTVRGEPWRKGMPDTDIHWIANEGVRVSCICKAVVEASVEARFENVHKQLIASFRDDLSQLPAVVAQGEHVTEPAGIKPFASGVIQIAVTGPTTFNLTAVNPPAPAPAVMPAPASVGPIAAEAKLRFDPKYSSRKGYDQDFLSVRVPLPAVSAQREDEILKKDGEPLVLKYHHFSLVMNQERQLQMWSAVNVDYTKRKRRKTREEFGTDTWIADPRIPGELQIQDADLYAPAKKFDRGHIVRRDDTAWGETEEEEILANSDSFHWTNCSPQHEGFNRAKYGYDGIWGGLENQIQSQAKNVGNKMSIFAGPVLDNANDIRHDFGAGEVLVPRAFWKILLVVEDPRTPQQRLRAYAFLLDQEEAIEEFGIERFSAGKFVKYQTTVAEIANLTGVTFDAAVLAADAFHSNEESTWKRLESLDHVIV